MKLQIRSNFRKNIHLVITAEFQTELNHKLKFSSSLREIEHIVATNIHKNNPILICNLNFLRKTHTSDQGDLKYLNEC